MLDVTLLRAFIQEGRVLKCINTTVKRQHDAQNDILLLFVYCFSLAYVTIWHIK